MTTPARRSLLSRSAQLFAAEVRSYCLSALAAGALGIASLTTVSLLMLRGGAEVAWDPKAIWMSMSFSQQMLSILGVLLAFWAPILLAARAVCLITAGQLTGEPISPDKVFSDMARFIPVSLIYSLVIGGATMIGFSILIIPGIFIASLFALVVPTSVYEYSGIVTTLRRGVSLSNRVWNKTLLLTFVSGVLVAMLIVFRNIFLGHFLLSPRFSLIIVAIAYIPALLVLILANISFTLLYNEAQATESEPVSEPPVDSEGRVPSLPVEEGSASQNLNSRSASDGLE